MKLKHTRMYWILSPCPHQVETLSLRKTLKLQMFWVNVLKGSFTIQLQDLVSPVNQIVTFALTLLVSAKNVDKGTI